jgi:hypothetical protein
VTLSEIRTEIWEALGKPTDLDPSVDATRLTRWVNEAQTVLGAWRDPDSGRIFRYHGLFGSLNYKSKVLSDTIATVSNDDTPYYLELDGDEIGTGDDRYNDWVVEITSGDADGEVRLITDYDSDNSRIYYANAFNTEPSADDTVSIYKRFDYLLPEGHSWVSEHIQLPATSDSYLATGNLMEVLNVYDITNRVLLEKGSRVDMFKDLTAGHPTMWYRYGNRLFYNCNQNTDDVDYRLEYFRNPMSLSSDGDVPELPLQYHRAIVLQGIIFGHIRTLEYDKKWMLQQDLKLHMRQVVSQWDIRDERIDNQLEVRYE